MKILGTQESSLPFPSSWARAPSAWGEVVCVSWHPSFPPHNPLPRFPSLSLKKLFVSSYPQLCELKVWTLRQISRLSVHPWGCLPLSHILSLSLLPVVSKEGAWWRRQIQRHPSPPGRLRAPLAPKPNGPFSEHFPINTIISSTSPGSEGGRQVHGQRGSRIKHLQVLGHTLVKFCDRKETSTCNQNPSEIAKKMSELNNHVRTKIILALWVILHPGTNIQVGAIWALNHNTAYYREELV